MAGLMTKNVPEPMDRQPPYVLPESLLSLVKNIISESWAILLVRVQQGAFSVCEGHEDPITEQLLMILGELQTHPACSVTGYNALPTPVREPKIRDYEGRVLDRMPDLVFYPLPGSIKTHNTAITGLFVECKPIDSKHPVNSTYCQKGLIRYLNGAYAWAMDKALMVAYVRNDCALPEGLEPHLTQQAMACDSSRLIESTSSGECVLRSVHRRDFSLGSSGQPVGQILIDHLWLTALPLCESTRCTTRRSS